MANRILLIEDDEAIRESLIEVLALEGYEVQSAENGKKGLELLEAQAAEWKPNLILLDLTMPVMNGHEFLVLQKAHPEFSDIPVAVFTAAGKQFRPPLADAFVSKPLDLDALFELVGRFCYAVSA